MLTGVAMTYAALEGTPIHVVPIKLTDGHGGVLMRVHLDEGEAAIGLEARLDDETEVLEQRHEIVLTGVGREVADVAGRLPLGRLLHHHVVALDTMGGEVVMAVRGGGGHAHGGHLGLLRHRRLSLLIGPVATDGARSQPFAVHGAERFLRIWTLAEGNKSIATRSAGLHVPHDARLRDGAERGECLEEDLVVDFVGQITDEDVEMVGRVFLVLVVRLIGPVDADFLEKKFSPENNMKK